MTHHFKIGQKVKIVFFEAPNQKIELGTIKKIESNNIIVQLDGYEILYMAKLNQILSLNETNNKFF